MVKFKEDLDPKGRKKYLDYVLPKLGFFNVVENPFGAYGFISLTNTPQELKPIIQSRQDQLKKASERKEIKFHDPAVAEFSPDKDFNSPPTKIFNYDGYVIAENRFFMGHDLLPTTGVGVEKGLAYTFGRIAINLMDANFSVSRMQTPRTIYLKYTDFEKELPQILQVFDMLKNYEPGMGFLGQLPILTGYPKRGGKAVDLEETVYREFPNLQYLFNPDLPILKLRLENPELFYEFRQKR